MTEQTEGGFFHGVTMDMTTATLTAMNDAQARTIQRQRDEIEMLRKICDESADTIDRLQRQVEELTMALQEVRPK